MCALYQALGVAPTASKRAIALRQLHPDVNKAHGADAKFQQVRDAYEVLSDDARRREYDRQVSPPRASRPHAARARGTHGDFGFMDQEARRMRQEHEELRRRAEAQFFMQFNRSRYRASLSESLFRFLPVVLPIWTVLLLYSFYRNRPVERTSPEGGPFWDQKGQAFARDAYGRLHRMPDLDRQVI
eukprot:CAMPEP_0114690256 /NCGR_PEP_ID=MMETSP0191-20121206/65483_1 /TAXON_ID=126664 /ORGANISM="Sorites sp." /LENGTH=185 /DNA_ID=CAMNT_0001979931 /DNA_START=35 /DNA_END=593 /DNA_ORIENTATION=-